MTLHDFMKSSKITDGAMAELLGCSEGGVRKWRYRQRIPRPDQMRKISEVTAGKVSATDFYAEHQESAA